jgi:hypothetical protein
MGARQTLDDRHPSRHHVLPIAVSYQAVRMPEPTLRLGPEVITVGYRSR